MSKDKIFNLLEKEEIFRRTTIGHYAIINLKNFPEWDTLLIFLANQYRQYNLKQMHEVKE